MILGIGTDICDLDRIDHLIKSYGDRFLDRFFTEKEQEYFSRHSDKSPIIAGRFAAKEAVSKACGTGFRDNFTMKDIEITNDNLGKPTVSLSPQILAQFPNQEFLVSISHEKKYAVAFAIRQRLT